MKSMRIIVMALVAFSPGLVLADNAVKFKYAGDPVGKQVCRAIVRDDVKQFQKVLRSYRKTLVYRYSFNDPAGRALAGSFTCNDMELREFSYSVGAEQVLGYLTPAHGRVEEHVVVVGK
jgi:hypothetical protein